MSLINPNDTVERQNEKLVLIAQSLMRRVEQKNDQSGLAYQQFERAALLESEVRERTHDLERALDLLQESNARLEIANDETEKARSNLTEAIETINEGFALFEDDDGLILFNSRFCRDLVDIENELVPGLSFENYVELISESSFLALPEDQTPFEWAAQRLSKHREDHVVFNVRLKWDRWLQVSEHRTTRGGTVILQTDVTTIIRRERQERDKIRDKQAEILQATLDHLNQGVCIFDNDLRLVGLNSKMEELIVRTAGKAGLGTDFSELLEHLKNELLFESNMDAAVLKDWAQLKTKREPILFEVSSRQNSIYNVFAQEMPDRGFVISFTNVTAERIATRELSNMNETLEQRVQDRTNELGLALAEAERANASKSRFVAAASHDLLQPLSAAKLFVSALSEQIDTPDAHDVINKTETALNSVEHFISALLDISKLDADKVEFDIQPLRLSKVLTPLRSELTPIAQQQGNDLTVVDSSLTVRSDPGYLRRIVQNLLTNAIRYTDDGRILVGVRRCADMARIEVWDTGHGIAPKDQATIFREFERLSPIKSDMGLGLGLSIVERACKGLGHNFYLRSELGAGSCFSVEIPLDVQPSQEVSAAGKTHSSIVRPVRCEVALLISDDVTQTGHLSDLIEGFGATVIHAHDVKEALSILAEIELVPDAIVINETPGTGAGGLDVHNTMKEIYHSVPFAIITKEKSRLSRKVQTGKISFIDSPAKPEQLSNFLSGQFSPL
ncbi:MAG: PAS-domain containing protein [Paracoccaceae bacterium]